MQKAKYKIKGLDFKSSVALIEEKLQSKEGVIKAKVNFESRKAVVLFDERKISESEIETIVTKTGEYQLEKIEEAVEPEQSEAPLQSERPISPTTSIFTLSPKTNFWLGFLISFSAFSLILNIFFATSLFKSTQAKAEAINQNAAAKNAAGNNGANPSPSPTPTTAETTVQNFDITKADHVRGDFNAPVTLVEFSDFECPYCEKHFPTLNKILDDYPGKVRLVYKHFPLASLHPNAQKAAEASECADEQDKFWEYHDKLFAGQPTGFSLDKFKQWAKDLGLKADQFNNCLDNGKYAQKVQTDAQEGQQKGVQGTPATFVNGRLVSGAAPYDSFKQVINTALIQ
ncbi:MAG: hypothetical protein COT24_05500 [Candidatus Kerfeldbacteria bacterium CG08_land_8_20_14_0_20_40_16]|uniref:Thioredoxin domain-containing protein n=1 Tax=Candidatus Kerfeldbacteria bacterium CG08_land_8_20_14_0_20_40_16 TaxID=2014244 RepID=A0A2H0YUF3_9BACT|nr:MAG: hypothetical protein COT24_05500 [Candidatus Kerfeldbacteria bacterium CG08_land_8_20_14_0_20_40_16]